MCIPMAALAIAGVVASAASGVMGYMGQKAEYKAQMHRYEQNAKASVDAAQDRYASIQTRILQEEEAASLKKQEASLDALKTRSTGRAAAGEAGVTGLSVDALLQDLSSQEGRFESTVDQNYQMNENYLRGEMDATQNQAEARVRSVPYPTKPSFGAALVNIFSSGLNTFSQFQTGAS